ncbi:MAG TPA: archaetidylserine decarboxylase [Bacillota bacterium]|nr:archaetidylserine decarboxylase [Bacillota bacterium]
MKDRFLLFLMKLMPTHAISRLVGYLAEKSFSQGIIPIFAKKFDIAIEEAQKPIHEYKSLNEFFTRKLKPGMRPMSSNTADVVSPADGKIAAFGLINEGKLIQAKGVYYTVWDLLGISKQEGKRYEGGKFITIYLSPRDYHRVHSPIRGKITDFTYLPGTLFPVNAFGVRAVDGLFAKNERLITFVESKAGRVGVVKVGATIVGSVKVVYHDHATTNVRAGQVQRSQLTEAHPIERGEEIGYFRFGSTVVLVFEKEAIEFQSDLRVGQKVKMGETIACMQRN